MAFAFPDAEMLTCNRHLRVNYFTDKIGVPHAPKMRLLSAIFGDNGLVHSTGEVVFYIRLEVAYREMRRRQLPNSSNTLTLTFLVRLEIILKLLSSLILQTPVSLGQTIWQNR